MALSSGFKLGPYEVISLLGAGGMGEVYKAKDSRLDRIVAIKVLPSNLSRDQTLQTRFEREARTISNLSHPNICTLHDVGHHDGLDFIVMEYLEGETLFDRIQKGPLPLDQLLQYAIQVAEALDKAHKLKVIHRDLKPQNIMITKSGVKLLDFGLAKFRESEVQSEESQLTTRDHSLTKDGLIVGTLHYMAPEQLEGKEADERSDIFAFGTTLYEMATGKKPFFGNTKAGIIASILSTEPPTVSELNPSLPPLLTHIIGKCIAKNPDERWQCAHDLSSELKWIAKSPLEKSNEFQQVTRKGSYERLVWAGIVLALASILIISSFKRSPVSHPVSLAVLPPENTMFDGSIELSQDGQKLAFVATGATGTNLVWVRSLDSMKARPISGTEGAEFPFWSPDGSSLGFFAEGKLKRISLTSQVPETLCAVTDARGGTWNKDGVILFSSNAGGAIYRVLDKGGTKQIVTKPNETQASYRSPSFLPDNKHFLLFVIANKIPESGVYLGSLDSTETRKLVSSESGGVFAGGNLFYIRESNLRYQPFDIKQFKVIGEPVSVAEQPWISGVSGLTAFSSTSNVLAYRSGGSQKTQFVWFDRTGKELGTVGPPAVYFEPALSPDEKRISTSKVEQGFNSDIVQLELLRGTSTRFSLEPSVEAGSIWSPDGSRIIYSSFPEGAFFEKPSNESSKSKKLLEFNTFAVAESWSFDGKFVTFTTIDFKTYNLDTWILSLSNNRASPYLQSEFNETSSHISPDGKWLAYTSDESGRFEVYVQSFPQPGNKIQISTSGGDTPQWRKDGKEIFYISPDKKIMSVTFNESSTLEPSIPKVLFQTQIASNIESRNQYVVTGDGQRFLVNTPLKEIATAPINVLVNWSAAK
jgi:serine/threonine protein kinase